MVSKKNKRILIVEDEMAISRALRFKLEHEGFGVENVGDGQKALELLKKDKKFDLILLDLIMPVVDGFSFLKEMKAKRISIDTIILSNLNQAEDKEKAKKLGAKDFFVKANVPVSNIVSKVKEILKV